MKPDAPEKIYIHPDIGGREFLRPWLRRAANNESVEYTRTDILQPGFGGSDGAARIAKERRRQIEKEGYDEEHDAQEPINRMVACAISYAMYDIDEKEADAWWEWDRQYFKPKDRLRNLERAGALIAAAIDKLQIENKNS